MGAEGVAAAVDGGGVRIGRLALTPQAPRVAASFWRVHEAAAFARWRRAGLEIAELRLDLSEAGVSAAALRAACGDLPTIVTARWRGEYGAFAEDERARARLLTAPGGGDAVDVELAAPIVAEVAEAVLAQGRTLIVSRHNFVAADGAAALDDAMAAALAHGAHVFKCACLCRCARDLRVLCAFAERCRGAGRACVVIGMDDGGGGGFGRRARVALPLHGSCVAFAAVGRASAPGQLSLAQTAAVCRAAADAVSPGRFEVPVR